MMVIDAKYELGQTVYLKTDEDQKARFVTRYSVSTTGITYELTCGTSTSWHYDFELSDERDVLKSTR